MLHEDDLDNYLAKHAVKKGWAENKLKYAARILRYVQQKHLPKEETVLHISFRNVIAFLEMSKVEKQVE